MVFEENDWIPAFAGMTVRADFGLITKPSNLSSRRIQLLNQESNIPKPIIPLFQHSNIPSGE
jgi:hypothetical protein